MKLDQNIQWVTLPQYCTVQPLPPRMVGLVVWSPSSHISIGKTVDADKETFYASEQSVIVACPYRSESFGISTAAKGVQTDHSKTPRSPGTHRARYESFDLNEENNAPTPLGMEGYIAADSETIQHFV